ncbi:MAG: ring-cleaving dioxygenase [Gemmatimonadota bacterium]
MSSITGLHHVTAIAGDPQENLDFYNGVLGMRLVKKSVNQDVTDTYHLFYADADGHAGTDLTFFPWPDMPPGQKGVGLTNEVSLAVPSGSLAYWAERLAAHGVRTSGTVVRFGERVLPFTDPHGLALTLTETSDPREFTAWTGSVVPTDKQIMGLHAVRLVERSVAPTRDFLINGMVFTELGVEDGWHRYAIGRGGSGRFLDLLEAPNEVRGAWGVGSVHHVAWRVADDATELVARTQVRAAGAHPTEVIDRFWFKSVYFKEPGGALFEIATDGPGFEIDEPAAALGERLILPPWLESQRAQIEMGLQPLRAPTQEARSVAG